MLEWRRNHGDRDVHLFSNETSVCEDEVKLLPKSTTDVLVRDFCNDCLLNL